MRTTVQKSITVNMLLYRVVSVLLTSPGLVEPSTGQFTKLLNLLLEKYVQDMLPGGDLVDIAAFLKSKQDATSSDLVNQFGARKGEGEV